MYVILPSPPLPGAYSLAVLQEGRELKTRAAMAPPPQIMMTQMPPQQQLVYAPQPGYGQPPPQYAQPQPQYGRALQVDPWVFAVDPTLAFNA